MIAQFGGVLAPLQMVLSIPLELSGVFVGLWLAHQSFSTVSIMAVIVLTGMDITTAILLIDQIQRRRAEGELPRDEAIALACRDRLRPILMTSLITIVTMLPVALAPRMGIDAYQPLGTVIVAGLTVGTLLSLLIIPVMHAIVDDLNNGAARQGWKKQQTDTTTNGSTTIITIILLAGLLFVGAGDLARAQGNTSTSQGLPNPPAASGALSLKNAVDLALRNAPTIKQAEADLRSATASTRSAIATRRPVLSTSTYLTTGDSSNIVTSSPGVMPQNVFAVSPRPFADQNFMLMIPLTTGGRLESNVTSAKRQDEAMAVSVVATRLMAEEAVTEAYVRTLLGQAILEAAEARLTVEDEQVRITGDKVTTGRLAPVDLLREQAEQADARQAVLEAKNTSVVALVELKTAMGVSQASEFTLSDTLDSLMNTIGGDLPTSLAEAVRLAYEHRPELLMALRQVEAARSGIKAMRATYAPQIYGVAMVDGTVSREMNGGRAGYTVGITASLPILDGGQRRADTDMAKSRVDRAIADAQKMRQGIAQEAASAWLTYDSATAKFATAQVGVVAAEKGYELANLRYNAGKSITAERLDALSTLTRARTTLAQAKAEKVISVARLRAATGSNSVSGK